ncbi:MAG: DUF2332 domain-containing protein [Acidimicrobiales bacterium]
MASDIAHLWRVYAATGPGSDAPVYRAIATSVADDYDLLAIATEAPPAAHHPNHLLAAVRFLLLAGVSHPLEEAYDAEDVVAAVALFKPFVLEHRGDIVELLQHRRVQTNEVGRTSAIAPALAHVARSARRGLGLVEVGASAGLNLLVDRCYLDYGAMQVGEASSPIRIDCAVDTPPAAFNMADLSLSWRKGLDQAPIDVNDEESVRWLLACVWVGQTDRQDRLRVALDMASGEGVSVVKGDAVADLGAMVDQIPDDLHAVVLTSWVTFYLNVTQRVDFEQALANCRRPVSWLSIEHPGVVVDIDRPSTRSEQEVTPSVVAHVQYSSEGDRSAEFLGWAHPHGSWLDWYG